MRQKRKTYRRKNDRNSLYDHLLTYRPIEIVNPHQAFLTSIVELFLSQWRNRLLIAQMTRREAKRLKTRSDTE